MNPYLIAPGIRFNDHVFSEPRRLREGALPQCGGIFVILVRDPNWAPKHFQPLCFREFGNNSQDSLLNYHPLRSGRVTDLDALYVSVLPMPFSTAAQRCDVRNQLVWAYNPVCQTNGMPSGQNELAQKLDQLEKKHEEQTTQLHLLLANINRLFEPQAEPHRRSIGFLAKPAA
jgi:hypothetical protein